MSFSNQQNFSIRIEDLSFQVLLEERPENQLLLKRSAVEETNSSTLHTHFFSELFICESGSIEIKTADGIISLLSGDILIIPAKMEHVKLSCVTEAKWKSIYFSCSNCNSRSKEKFYRHFQGLCTGNRPVIMRACPELNQRVLYLMQRISENHLHFFALELINLLSYIVDYNTDKISSPSHVNASYHNDMDMGRISRLEILIATKFSNDLKAQEVAKQFYISVRQLDRICIKRYGVTFRQAVNNRRFLVAIEMFENTQMTIEQIGIAVGFNSRVAFSRAFSAKYGMSPNQYRKQFCSR